MRDWSPAADDLEARFDRNTGTANREEFHQLRQRTDVGVLEMVAE